MWIVPWISSYSSPSQECLLIGWKSVVYNLNLVTTPVSNFPQVKFLELASALRQGYSSDLQVWENIKLFVKYEL